MSERIKYFLNLDDDYLVGLSNKGILKRSYKDLENVAVTIAETEECIEVSMEEVSCKLYMPLGDSKCSCPSRSMCKHIVMGAITLKRKYEAGGDRNADGQSENIAGVTDKTNLSVEDKTNSGQEALPSVGMKSGQDNQSTTDMEVKQGAQPVAGIGNSEEIRRTASVELVHTHSFPQLDSYTLEQIKKQLGSNAFRKLCQRMKVADAPDITITSVVTVTFADTDTIVKLLEPLAYSTCSCHKKELCVHKAEAIIAYQLHKGILTKDTLDSYYEGADNPEFDIDEIRDVTSSIKQLLGEVIFTGLARVSKDIADSCERMAIMCHNSRLANFESDFRRLSERLNKYFKRHATSDTTVLMHYVCEVYRKTLALEKALNSHTDTETLQQIAGKLRSEYELSKPLSLMGMGMRHFVSQAGFEGETVYFIEEKSGQWYTYTNARPIIYDNRGARGVTANSSAPWGLNCSLDTLSEHRIKLTNGKVSVENRLSSTSEAVAELIGNRDLNHEVFKSRIYSDFDKLFSEIFGEYWYENKHENKETNHLAIIRPSAVEEADFDSIRQAFYMRLVDEQGQSLSIKMTYTKEDKYIINHLERLYRRIKEGRRGVPDFFGRIYIEDGELRMYPIEYYDQKDFDKEEVS